MPTDLAAALPPASATDAPVQARRGLPALIVLAVAIASAAAMRGVFSPVQEVARLDLRLSDLQISMVQGLAASIPIAALSIPLGWLVDRGRRVWLLFALAAAWTAGTLATAYADGFAALFLARMIAGLGAVCALPVAISIASDLAPPERRGRALLLLSVGQTVGGAAAFALGGWLFGALAARVAATPILGLSAWRATHLLFGVASAALALPILGLREPARRETAHIAPALGPALAALWARRGFLAPLFIGQVGVVMADTAASIWAAPVLTRDFHQQPGQFAGWVGLTLLAAGLLGGISGGLAADFGQRSHRRGGVLLGAVAGAALSIPAAFFPMAPSVPVFGLLLGLLLLGGAISGLVTATAIAVLVPNEMRGLCLGAFIVVGAIVGFGVAPTLVTLGSQALGGETHLGAALAATGVVTSLVSLAAFVAAMRRAPDPIAA